MKKTPQEVWSEYQTGIDYHNQIEIYDAVELNQKFVNGDQWGGVNAPDIEKPVINILAPAVEWYNAMLVSDDIAISCDLEEMETGDPVQDELSKLNNQAMESIVIDSIEDIFEQTRYKQKLRVFCRNASIDGGSYKHWWFNTEKNTEKEYKGCADIEILDNVNVIFGNPAETDEQKQPYIIIVAKLPTEQVKEMAKKHADEIHDNWDDNTNLETDARSTTKYTTVLTKFWKEKGVVWFCKSTQNVMLKEATSLDVKLYPISKMNWKTLKNSYQGVSKLTEVIPNQIMVNKAYMMMNEFTKKMAFPKIIYNKMLIDGWSNKVEALGVDGDPRDSVVSVTPTVSFNDQLMVYVDKLIAETKQTLGLQDVSLGNVNPDNTSAIIALQKTAAQPLELQRLELFSSIEQDVRIIVELMATNYGVRPAQITTEQGEGTIMFDFADLTLEAFNMEVEVGQAYYWSNVTQVQTLDNMFRNKIIPNAITYLEQLPNGTVKNRNEIIKAIKKEEAKVLQAQQPQAQPMPQGLPIV